MEVNNWHKELTYDEWVPITVSGARPAARYKVSFSFFPCFYQNTEEQRIKRKTGQDILSNKTIKIISD